MQEKRLIKGIVKDDKGLPLPGVTVLVKGTMTGVLPILTGSLSYRVIGIRLSCWFFHSWA